MIRCRGRAIVGEKRLHLVHDLVHLLDRQIERSSVVMSTPALQQIDRH
jgi:hypothetical protein